MEAVVQTRIGCTAAFSISGGVVNVVACPIGMILSLCGGVVCDPYDMDDTQYCDCDTKMDKMCRNFHVSVSKRHIIWTVFPMDGQNDSIIVLIWLLLYFLRNT
jgi:hypothetical protein